MQSNFSVFERLDFSAEGIADIASDNLTSSVQQHHVNQARELELGVDKIYFSGDFPSIYFKSVDNFGTKALNQILDIHKKIWNQGKVAFLLVESPVEIRIYNCYEKPIKAEQEDRKIEELELFKASKQAEKDLETLLDVFGMVSIETGEFWKNNKYSQKLNHQRRVEQALMANLKETRLKLKNKGLDGSIGKTIIHDLLLRSLFILYLEDRKATNADFYNEFKPGAKSYFEVLEDVEGTYRLFFKLENSFNGNLSPVSSEERQIVNTDHLQLIKECFWSRLKTNGQFQLFDWRVFDFEVIPIELISAIYEDFLAEKEGTENQDKTGAFYTPRPLVEFILNKVLPHSSAQDSRYNIKILDPTCGSGIFLVESLNRLLDRWEYSNKGKKLDFETTKSIVLENVFGIDKQREAVKVAAFSIYLAMLDRLDPKTLWKNKKFPYLIYDPEEKDSGKQGKNLFIQSSIDPGAFDDIKFDLLVGNPPFSRGNLDKDLSAYLSKRDFPQEAVIAFLTRALELCPNGRIALVFAAKILFNKERPYQNFRHFLFNDTYVEEVYNFAALRKLPKSEGGNFFESAQSPTGVFFYSKSPQSAPSDRILYCSPKSTAKHRLIDGIVIDSPDVKYLPRLECKKPDTNIWKIGMWGTERDFKFIQKQSDDRISLNEEIQGWEQHSGVGFRPAHAGKYEHQNKFNDVIKNYKHIPVKNVERYYSLEENTHDFNETEFRWLGAINAYKAPHLLIKEGQSNKKFCASFIDYDCSFTDSIYGLHSPDTSKLKVLLGFLNSALTSYLLFLSPSSWGVERERVKPNEILDLPNLCFQLAQEDQSKIIKLVDKIIEIKKKRLNDGVDVLKLEKQIDEVLFQALGYTAEEKILIEDMLNLTLDAFQEKQKSIAYTPVTPDEEKPYATQLCKTLNNFLSLGSKTTCWATIFETSRRLPLKVISIHFNQVQAPAAVINAKEAFIHETLKSIESYTYQQYSESLYFRKFLRYYTADHIYIIKPNQKRFWSQSQALNDADEIIAEILAMKK